MTENQSLSDAIFAGLSVEKKAVDAICSYTRLKMYRLWHIPNRYYIPGCAEHSDENLAALYKEIGAYGFIDLDADGKPACLSGRPAVLGRRSFK